MGEPLTVQTNSLTSQKPVAAAPDTSLGRHVPVE
jgi:hypothetical protein